ncbi:MAG: hypothetical protein IPH31_23735 [Lewinellaceae bacterium]|nr:hypothetical protein [Lewinellaceae bacterium]
MQKPRGSLYFWIFTPIGAVLAVMDRDVFTNGDLAAFFSTSALNLKINAEKGEGVALAKHLGISGLPYPCCF